LLAVERVVDPILAEGQPGKAAPGRSRDAAPGG
jgi:hypothetical protein